MKPIFLIITICLGLVFSGIAQDDGSKNDGGGRLAALKIGYLTKKLNLSTDEAQKFWPIFNKYEDEIRGVRIEQRDKKIAELDAEEKILTIRKRYNNEFTKALSSDKVNTFFRVEKEFNVSIQKELLERRQQRLDNRKQRLNQQ